LAFARNAALHFAAHVMMESAESFRAWYLIPPTVNVIKLFSFVIDAAAKKA